MTKTITIKLTDDVSLQLPEGYRLLRPGETVSVGDKYVYGPKHENFSVLINQVLKDEVLWITVDPTWGVFNSKNTFGLFPKRWIVITRNPFQKKKKTTKNTTKKNKTNSFNSSISLMLKDLCESLVELNNRVSALEEYRERPIHE